MPLPLPSLTPGAHLNLRDRFSRVSAALKSRLPNEVDWALKTLLLLSHQQVNISEYSHVLNEIFFEPHLAHFVTAQSVGQLLDRDAADGRTLAVTDLFRLRGPMQDDISEGIADEQMRDEIYLETYEARLAQVSQILCNFAVSEANAKVMGKHLLVIQFLLRGSAGENAKFFCSLSTRNEMNAIYASYHALRVCCMDTISYISSHVKLTALEDSGTSLLRMLSHMLCEEDRWAIASALTTYAGLASVVKNQGILSDVIGDADVSRLNELLVVEDIQITLALLEALNKLTLCESIAHRLCQQPGVVGVLVRRLNFHLDNYTERPLEVGKWKESTYVSNASAFRHVVDQPLEECKATLRNWIDQFFMATDDKTKCFSREDLYYAYLGFQAQKSTVSEQLFGDVIRDMFPNVTEIVSGGLGRRVLYIGMKGKPQPPPKPPSPPKPPAPANPGGDSAATTAAPAVGSTQGSTQGASAVVATTNGSTVTSSQENQNLSSNGASTSNGTTTAAGTGPSSESVSTARDGGTAPATDPQVEGGGSAGGSTDVADTATGATSGVGDSATGVASVGADAVLTSTSGGSPPLTGTSANTVAPCARSDGDAAAVMAVAENVQSVATTVSESSATAATTDGAAASGTPAAGVDSDAASASAPATTEHAVNALTTEEGVATDASTLASTRINTLSNAGDDAGATVMASDDASADPPTAPPTAAEGVIDTAGTHTGAALDTRAFPPTAPPNADTTSSDTTTDAPNATVAMSSALNLAPAQSIGPSSNATASSADTPTAAPEASAPHAVVDGIVSTNATHRVSSGAADAPMHDAPAVPGANSSTGAGSGLMGRPAGGPADTLQTATALVASAATGAHTSKVSGDGTPVSAATCGAAGGAVSMQTTADANDDAAMPDAPPQAPDDAELAVSTASSTTITHVYSIGASTTPDGSRDGGPIDAPMVPASAPPVSAPPPASSSGSGNAPNLPQLDGASDEPTAHVDTSNKRPGDDLVPEGSAKKAATADAISSTPSSTMSTSTLATVAANALRFKTLAPAPSSTFSTKSSAPHVQGTFTSTHGSGRADSGSPRSDSPMADRGMNKASQPLVCPTPGCGRKYTNQNGLSYHIATGGCRRSGMDPGMLEEADRQYDKEGCLRVCDWAGCGRGFRTMRRLGQHVGDCHVTDETLEQGCRWADCPRAGHPISKRFNLLSHVHPHVCNSRFVPVDDPKLNHTAEKIVHKPGKNLTPIRAAGSSGVQLPIKKPPTPGAIFKPAATAAGASTAPKKVLSDISSAQLRNTVAEARRIIKTFTDKGARVYALDLREEQTFAVAVQICSALVLRNLAAVPSNRAYFLPYEDRILQRSFQDKGLHLILASCLQQLSPNNKTSP